MSDLHRATITRRGPDGRVYQTTVQWQPQMPLRSRWPEAIGAALAEIASLAATLAFVAAVAVMAMAIIG